MEDVGREISNIKEGKIVFLFVCLKIRLFSKTVMGKGGPSATNFVDCLFRKLY